MPAGSADGIARSIRSLRPSAQRSPTPALTMATTIAAIRATPVTVPLERRSCTATAPIGGASCGRSSKWRPPTATSAWEKWAVAARTRRARSRVSYYLPGHDVFALEAMRLKICNPTAASTTTARSSTRRSSLPASTSWARSSAFPCSASGRSCATPSSSRATFLRYADPGAGGRSAHAGADGRASGGAQGGARLHLAQAEGRRFPPEHELDALARWRRRSGRALPLRSRMPRFARGRDRVRPRHPRS